MSKAPQKEMCSLAPASASRSKVVRILGVDPGSRQTGYGIVDAFGRSVKHVTHGTVKLESMSKKASVPLEERLLGIYQGLSSVIEEFRPTLLSIEKVFFAKNAVSALKLGQARGAAILTARIFGLEVVEYSATEIKSAVCGHGQADKDQVAKMLQILLGPQKFLTADSSDGLAAALCHAQKMCAAGTPVSLLQNSLKRSPTKSKRLSLADAVAHRIDPKHLKGNIR